MSHAAATDGPDAPRPDPDAPDPLFPPARAAGLARLAAFVPRAGADYAARRGDDVPGHPHVSTLSPYLRHRAVTEAEACAAIVARHGPEAAAKAVGELCWRTYFKGWLERRPTVWDAYRAGLEAARHRLATESGLRRAWDDACHGRTGIAPFDHWAAEIVRTGYLHNHARMWFASIWMHTLGLPWELGADHFLRHLLDGDPASNTLSWRWVGGLHTPGKVYQARAGNIARHTGGRFDAEALGHRLAPRADVSEGPANPAPSPVPEGGAWRPSPRAGLLLHEDDLHPDFLLRDGLRPVAAAALIAPEDRSPLVVSDRVRHFAQALADDALARLPGPVRRADAATGDVEAVVRWAAAERLDQVVAPYAPCGPLRTKLDRLEARLGVPLVRALRPWDRDAWPGCTAGYFRFRERIPTLVETAAREAGRGAA
ncbi:FAD-binding domain-containing protein [Jannaschia sp. W003]|uniref:FAD-binding domain-containing protein n=1 Tax=Jannaschia sp. W003 TaxID=2867012 RepID=UPI0021A2BEAF|nr:FAD-binding domain-containing protein [Jannaschia sp. W003]UWQ21050.1 DNA photolyase [Jannaschia sp. W003]